MSSTEIQNSGEEPCFRLEHLPGKSPHLAGKSPHLAGKASPQVNNRWDAPEVTVNGVHDIEDRILRITGYYGYKTGYSSHRSKCSKTHAITNAIVMVSRSSHGCLHAVLALNDESMYMNVKETHAVWTVSFCL